MSLDLSSYPSIQTALFCRLAIPYYRVETTDTPTSVVLKFSSFNRPITIDGDTYQPLGTLLNVTDSQSSLRATSNELTVTLSGIPTNSIKEIINSKIKGSTIKVWRVLFDPVSGQQLAISGNPAGRFQGMVTNYAIEEDWTPGSTSVTNTIALSCASAVDVLMNKVSGRRTNSIDQKALYANDLSMDRVNTLAKSNFNFGAVIK